jgi:Rad3-related DNA helicase
MLWVEQTQTGDIAENAGFQLNQNWGLWGKLIAENNYCPGRTCKFYNDCFLMRARNNARKADVVVVNHSLLFSDLVADNSILGPYKNLILDEAHNLEKTAGDYLGIRFNWWTFRNIYHKLYEEAPRKAGVIAQLEYRLSQSRLPESMQDRLTKQISRVKTESISFKRITDQFFTELNKRLREKFQKQNQNGFEESKIRYHQNYRFFTELHEIIEDEKRDMRHLKKSVSTLLDIFTDIRAESFPFQDQIHRELISYESELENLIYGFDFCIAADTDNYVYWLELPLRQQSIDVSFNAVPLNIAELLHKSLYDQLSSAVFTSATLAVDESFEYYKDRVGLNLVQHTTLKTAILGSPFEYDSQLALMILDFLDDPRNERFTGQLSDLIKEAHSSHPTGMLVLFTSYSLLNRLYSEVKPHFEMEKVLLLAQGKSGSRTNIINQFREYKESVLFGTDSFWEGVDVPGEALELLIITKLPFDVPSEPLTAAKMEMIKRNGGNPFMQYSVPEAIIKFRQGFGRLIRHKNDIGAVLVCDNRLSRMQYGQHFLNSLPVEGKIFRDSDTLFAELKDWFGQKPTSGK